MLGQMFIRTKYFLDFATIQCSNSIGIYDSTSHDSQVEYVKGSQKQGAHENQNNTLNHSVKKLQSSYLIE